MFKKIFSQFQMNLNHKSGMFYLCTGHEQTCLSELSKKIASALVDNFTAKNDVLNISS